MRRAVSKLLLALLSLEAVSMSSFALTGTLADLENAKPETYTPKAIHAPQLSSAEEARIDKQLYDRMMKQARESRDPKAINAYLDLARKIKSKQLGGADETSELESRVAFYQEQIKTTAAADQSEDLYYELASSHDQLGHADAAVAVLTEMLKRFPKSTYAAEAHFRIAEAAFNRKQYQFATQEYQAVLSLGDSRYTQQARYFYAWSLYKDGRYEEAIAPFQRLIDNLQTRALENKRDALLLQDSYRTLSSIFVQLGGVTALAKYYDGKPLTDEEAVMYRQVGDRYREQKQLLDIAKVYEGFIQRHPQDAKAAVFSTDAIAVYKEANFAQDIIRSKNDFVQRYDVDQNYFKSASPELQATLRPALKSQLDDLAKHYDAVGQTQKSTADYLHAADLYHKQLALATEPADVMRVQQRLAEALYNGGKFEEAIPYFETLAYKTPAAKPSEMGYFALLSYQAHAKELANQPAQKQDEWLDLQRASSEQYATAFPADKSSPVVLLAMAGQYLDRKRFDILDDLARSVLALPNLSASDTKTASILKANADFDQQQWAEAEASYRQVLALSNLDASERTRYQNQRAASLYKQAEVAKAANQLDASSKLYQQAGKVTQDDAVKVDSSYQAAMLYAETPQALPLLQQFYSLYPTSPQAEGIPERIVKLQETVQDWSGASQTYLKIYQRDHANKAADKQSNALAALWLAAESERKVSANNPSELALYQQYLKEPNAVLAQNLEASERLYQAAVIRKDNATQQQELARQLQLYRNQFQSAPTDVQPRLRYLAARSLTIQSAPLIEQYRAISLTQPLKDSVGRKQALLQKVIESQQPILDLKVAEYVTQSQFVLGDSFARFYQGVLNVPVPTGLSDLEAEQYQIAIEEQTQPLKDKAIEWHKANASLVLDTWDTWIAQSFDALATLSSGRYLRPIKSPVIPVTDVKLARTAAIITQNPKQALTDLDQLLASAQKYTLPEVVPEQKKSIIKALVIGTGQAKNPNAPILIPADHDIQLIQSYRGIALLKLGQFKDAAEAFSASEAENQRSAMTEKRAEPAYLLGITDELYLNDQAAALAAYQRYLLINPEDKAVQKWVNLLQIELKIPLTVFAKPVVAPAVEPVNTTTETHSDEKVPSVAAQPKTPSAPKTSPENNPVTDKLLQWQLSKQQF